MIATPCMTLKDLKPGAWEGERCFLVGGGPSLRDFDWSLLEGELTIGINRAVESFIPTIAYARDEPFARWLRRGMFGASAIERWKEHPCAVLFGQHTSDLLYECEKKSNNSGLGALRLAVALGASEIYLLGFDMGGHAGEKQEHFHEGYPATQQEVVYGKLFIPAFESYAREAKRAAKIVNLNPDSRLRCFDFGKSPLEKDLKKVDPGKPSVWVNNPYLGFGDTAWMRPFLRILSRTKNIFIETCSPEMFWDLPYVFPVRPTNMHNLRVQMENAKVTHEVHYEIPKDAKKIEWPRYLVGPHTNKTIWEAFKTAIPGHRGPINGSLPTRAAWAAAAKDICRDLGMKEHQQLVLVKPPTTRKDWFAPAREPKMEYMQLVIDSIRKYLKNAFILFVGDIEKGGEEFVLPELTGADALQIRGELSFSTLLGLMSMANIIVGGQGMSLPIGIALGTPTFTVFGGAYRPDIVVDPQMDLSKWGYVAPDPFCDCRNFRHRACNKEIPKETVEREINEFLKKHCGVK